MFYFFKLLVIFHNTQKYKEIFQIVHIKFCNPKYSPKNTTYLCQSTYHKYLNRKKPDKPNNMIISNYILNTH